MNLEKLLEYIRVQRAAYKAAWESLLVNGNRFEAHTMWARYDTIDTIYFALTDENFAKTSYKNWLGKELTP